MGHSCHQHIVKNRRIIDDSQIDLVKDLVEILTLIPKQQIGTISIFLF